MIPRTERRHAVFRATSALGVFTAGTIGLALAFPDAASAAAVTVNYGSCASSNPAVAAAPAPYSTSVTLTPSATTATVGQAITITWHQATSTAPVAIPIANAASAKAKIVVGGPAASTITTGSSAMFPPAPVAAGGTFQIPDFNATFTPTAAGTYTFTPGDNEQDGVGGIVVITCKASGAGVSASVTVTAAATGGAAGGSGATTPSTTGSRPSTSTSTGASTSSSATTGSTSGSTGATTGADSPTTGATSAVSTLPHTGFNGLWLVGGMAGAAVLGGGGLFLTRRRAGQS